MLRLLGIEVWRLRVVGEMEEEGKGREGVRAHLGRRSRAMVVGRGSGGVGRGGERSWRGRLEWAEEALGLGR